jgi:hypothetical protein
MTHEDPGRTATRGTPTGLPLTAIGLTPRENAAPVELTAAQLQAAAGGLNPQPLPPGRYQEFR